MNYFLSSNKVKCEEEFEPEHVYTFSGKCIITGQPVTVTVKSPDLYKYNQGAFIQHAFPYLSANEREWLKTGIFELPNIAEED